MAYKFQRGEAILSGALLQEGSIEIESGFEFSMHDETVLDTSRNLTVADMSGSGKLEVGGTVQLDGVASTDLDVTVDSVYFLDSDGFMKKDSFANIMASAVAGDNGLIATDGVLSIDLHENGGIEQTGDALQIKAGGVTNSMLSGAIENDKLVNDSVTVTAGAALSGGGEVDLGATINLDVEVDDSSIEVSGDALQLKALGITNDMLAGSIASDKIAELNAFDTADLAEGSNLYFTEARARASVSVTDAGGDGSLSYDSSTGVISYTGPSADEVRAHLSTGYMIDVAAGQFSIDAAEFSGSWDDVLATKDTGDLAEGSNLYYTDDRVHAALSVSDSNSIDMTYDAAGDFSADLRISGSQLEVTADGLRLAALAADGTTMELSDDSLSVLKVPNALSQGEGIAAFSFDGSSALTIGLSASVAGDGLAYSSGVLSLDLDELTAADVNVAADFIAIVDADDNSTKKESVADLVSAMAGAGLTATDGVLKVTGNDVHSKADGDTLQEGYNYFADASADAAVTLPASPSDGDVVHVKAGDLTSDAVITISAQGSHNIDTETAIVLESPFAAVSLVYVGNNDWRIV